MSEEYSNRGQNYKLLDTPKRSVLLLVRDSERPHVQTYMQEYMKRYPTPVQDIQIEFPDKAHSIDDLIAEGCDVAVVDPLAYRGVNRVKDLLAKVTEHTRKGLVIVQRGLNYEIPPTPKEREICEGGAGPAVMALKIYDILFPGVRQAYEQSKMQQKYT